MDNLEANIMDKSMRSVFGNYYFHIFQLVIGFKLFFQWGTFLMKPPKRNSKIFLARSAKCCLSSKFLNYITYYKFIVTFNVWR